MFKKKIKVKFFNGSIYPDYELKKIKIGDWVDLRAAEDVYLKKGDLYYINLGVAMQLPKGYEAYVAPRSSTPKNFGIICANSFGIIDNSFCGDNDEWKLPVYAIRDTYIEMGDRICQFRIVKNQPMLEFEYVDILGNSDRGGYGSTGKK